LNPLFQIVEGGFRYLGSGIEARGPKCNFQLTEMIQYNILKKPQEFYDPAKIVKVLKRSHSKLAFAGVWCLIKQPWAREFLPWEWLDG